MSTPVDDLEPKLVIEPLTALSVLDEIGDRIDDVDDLDLDSI